RFQNSRRRFVVEPFKKAIPIPLKSKRLRDCVSPYVCPFILQLTEECLCGRKITPLCKLERTKEMRLLTQSICRMEEAKSAEKPPSRAIALPNGKLRSFSQSYRGQDN